MNNGELVIVNKQTKGSNLKSGHLAQLTWTNTFTSNVIMLTSKDEIRAAENYGRNQNRRDHLYRHITWTRSKLLRQLFKVG